MSRVGRRPERFAASSDGYWSFIPPLASGDYTLTFGATFPSSLPAQPPFTFNITYRITVQ